MRTSSFDLTNVYSLRDLAKRLEREIRNPMPYDEFLKLSLYVGKTESKSCSRKLSKIKNVREIKSAMERSPLINEIICGFLEAPRMGKQSHEKILLAGRMIYDYARAAAWHPSTNEYATAVQAWKDKKPIPHPPPPKYLISVDKPSWFNQYADPKYDPYVRYLL